MLFRKKPRTPTTTSLPENLDLFDGLPDDLVVFILCKLSSSASSPSDLINILFTCKRLNRLGLHPLVLSEAGPKAFAIKAKNWSESVHRFLKLCANAGNVEASYTLGMIRFYCFQKRGSGASLMAKAAMKSHAPALYSLAVIQFNGSGGSKSDKNLQAGVALCARAGFLGHVDALRELGHCLQDGYGARQNVAQGRRLLVQANARELASVVRSRSLLTWQRPHQNDSFPCSTDPCCGGLLSDFGCNVPAPEPHPVNRFLKEWFESSRGRLDQGLRLCSHGGCGRVETRSHEFRRCSVCGKVNYCSRGCQALDWKLRHKLECMPMERWLDEVGAADNGADGVGGMVEVEDDTE
ncbi:F-box protein At5g50450-like [Juglans microcarpa x Juglans regia]|uniref:F-box protein At5g50450-like n=1 Tax=Juglans microcarpa x Juglans regia TaxID=2249226 RepID=UPI001B7DEC6F|nr:F-box protein At5g50450-like [Juglans microcarpa x Juglans regia]